ncbi:hypothetical protein KCP73_07295 [Salmonella enterica subsp. enterica]|nr:hypothetical protein KCP73_07295 [Salmonella enterica subsp. enterica]
MTYTAINIPGCSLGGVITNDPKSAWPVRLMASLFFCVSRHRDAVALLANATPMVDWFGGGDKAKVLSVGIPALAIIGRAACSISKPASANAFKPCRVPTHDDMKNDFKDVWKTISGQYAFCHTLM